MELGSVPVVPVDPVVEVRGSVVALIGLEATEVLTLVDSVDVVGPGYELAEPPTYVGPLTKVGSVDEVSCSAEETVFFAIPSVAPVVHVGPLGLVGPMSEVIVCNVESVGPVVMVGPCVQIKDPVVEAPDPVLEI